MGPAIIDEMLVDQTLWNYGSIHDAGHGPNHYLMAEFVFSDTEWGSPQGLASFIMHEYYHHMYQYDDPDLEEEMANGFAEACVGG